MLELSPLKRTPGMARTPRDLRFEICDGGRPVGALIYDRRRGRCAFTLGREDFQVDSRHHGLETPPSPDGSTYTLTNSLSAQIACAERDRGVYAVDLGRDSFILQACKAPQSYQLLREGDVEILGGVGQRAFPTARLVADLPDAFCMPFRVFLASLLLDEITGPCAARAD